MFPRNATAATHLSSTAFSAKGEIFLLQVKASRSQTFMFELVTAAFAVDKEKWECPEGGAAYPKADIYDG